MTIVPTATKIVCRLNFLRPADKIILPDASQTTPAMMPYGLVVSIGPDVKTVKVNDKVLVLPSNYTGFVDPNDPDNHQKALLVTDERNVIGKYEEESNSGQN